MAELIDIYDAQGRTTGRTAERGGRLAPGDYMLYVLALIQDEDGRYLITRRAADKRWAAGWWEVTGGGVRAGETSAEAIQREVREETGLDVGGILDGSAPLLPGSTRSPIWRYRNDDATRGDNYLVDIYHFRMAFDLGDVTLQRREATDVRLASAADIDELARQGIFLHYERLREALAAQRE